MLLHVHMSPSSLFDTKGVFTCSILTRSVTILISIVVILASIEPLLAKCAPPSLRGCIERKANVMKRCPKVKQNMRINMVLTIFDNIVWFKRNLKK